MDASIIIPVYNREDLIIPCLTSLLKQEFNGSYEILIVDDASTDKTFAQIKSFIDPKIIVLQNTLNRGPAYSRNLGVSNAKGIHIALIDSDCIADPHWLSEILASFKIDPAIKITAGQIIDDAENNYWSKVNSGVNFISHKKGYVSYAIGCNMAITKEFLRQHPFDPRIRNPGGEEAELCLLARKSGNKIYYSPNAKVTHRHKQTLFSTLKQHFYFGYGNTFIGIKHHNFPYINYGTWLLIAAFLSLIFHVIRLFPLIWISRIFLCAFFGLVAYKEIRKGVRSINELVIAYPGLLLRYLSECLGNLYYFFNR